MVTCSPSLTTPYDSSNSPKPAFAVKWYAGSPATVVSATRLRLVPFGENSEKLSWATSSRGRTSPSISATANRPSSPVASAYWSRKSVLKSSLFVQPLGGVHR